MPTAKDLDDLIAKGHVIWSGSSNWKSIGVAPAGNSTGGDNAHGFWQPVSGRFVGTGAKAGDNKQCPADGIIALSASGCRINGTAYDAGNYGYWWCGSSNGTSYAMRGYVYSGGADRFNDSHRTIGFVVRCVKVIERESREKESSPGALFVSRAHRRPPPSPRSSATDWLP